MSAQEMPDIPKHCLSCPFIVKESEAFILAERVRDAMVFNLNDDDRPTPVDIELQNEEVEIKRKKLQEVGARAIGCPGLLILKANIPKGEYVVRICDSPVFTESQEHYEPALVRRKDI